MTKKVTTIAPKKVEKTTPTKSTTKSTKSTTPVKSTTTATKKSNKVETPIIKKQEIKIVGLDDLLKTNKDKKDKKDKKPFKFEEKGDKLVEKILSFFGIQGITKIKLNEIEKLENELKDNNTINNKVVKKVTKNYSDIIELINNLQQDSNEILALSVLLVITRSVSSYNSPKFVESIIKNDKFEMIQIISKYFIDTSCNDIVSLIKFIIENNKFKSIKEQLEQQDSAVSVSTSNELDSILSIPLNHNFMVVSIRSLSIDSVLLLLKYLYSRISLFSLNEQVQTTATESTNTSLTLKQIIDWISLIFDSHFQELIQKIENINQYFGPIRSLQNNTKSFFYTKSFIDFLEKSENTKSIENNDYSIYHYKF